MQPGEVRALRDREARAGKIPPRQRREPRAAGPGADLVRRQNGIALLDQRRATLLAAAAPEGEDDGQYPADDDWQDEPEDAAAPARP